MGEKKNIFGKKIYVLKFCTGLYDDYTELLVKSFLTKRKANSYKKKIDAQINSLSHIEIVKILSKEFDDIYIDQAFGLEIVEVPLAQ